MRGSDALVFRCSTDALLEQKVVPVVRLVYGIQYVPVPKSKDALNTSLMQNLELVRSGHIDTPTVFNGMFARQRCKPHRDSTGWVRAHSISSIRPSRWYLWHWWPHDWSQRKFLFGPSS